CASILLGPPIPEEDQKSFGGHTHFTRLIGVEDETYDEVSSWECPDCRTSNGRWPWNSTIIRKRHETAEKDTGASLQPQGPEKPLSSPPESRRSLPREIPP